MCHAELANPPPAGKYLEGKSATKSTLIKTTNGFNTATATLPCAPCPVRLAHLIDCAMPS